MRRVWPQYKYFACPLGLLYPSCFTLVCKFCIFVEKKHEYDTYQTLESTQTHRGVLLRSRINHIGKSSFYQMSISITIYKGTSQKAVTGCTEMSLRPSRANKRNSHTAGKVELGLVTGCPAVSNLCSDWLRSISSRIEQLSIVKLARQALLRQAYLTQPCLCLCLLLLLQNT